MEDQPLLTVDGLSVSFVTDAGTLAVVDAVSFTLASGRILALVGESGCGKSVTASALMRLLPQPMGRVTAGAVVFQGRSVLDLPQDEVYHLRGGGMAMVFQEPATALNPIHTVGHQLKEVLILHRPDVAPADRNRVAVDLLTQVEIPLPETRLNQYPFQLSGGMRQRVMIAMALAGKPGLLIADEPTTALDVTIQAQILKLIVQVQRETGMGVLYITHDMGVVAEVADEVAVMYAGQIVEQAPVDRLFADPAHPYTQGLLRSMPRLDSEPKSLLPSIPGTVPSPANFSKACRFADRCPRADELCRTTAPVLGPLAAPAAGAPEAGAHLVRCHHPGRAS
jgi:peptide/nickel transport system ATP-binding protein